MAQWLYCSFSGLHSLIIFSGINIIRPGTEHSWRLPGGWLVLGHQHKPYGCCMCSNHQLNGQTIDVPDIPDILNTQHKMHSTHWARLWGIAVAVQYANTLSAATAWTSLWHKLPQHSCILAFCSLLFNIRSLIYVCCTDLRPCRLLTPVHRNTK